MNELLEWNITQKTQAATKAEEYLEARRLDLENIKKEREALIKKAGKKAAQVEQQLGVLKEEPYLFLSEPILEELLEERLKHPECGAGAIFDNLASRHYPTELIAMKIIFKVLRNYTVQTIILQPQFDEKGFPVNKINLNLNINF
jgi:hypothetical protein